MTTFTKWGKNVIFCGPAQMLDQPIRKESPVAAALLPGTAVVLGSDGKFAAAGAASVGLRYVLDKDHLAQLPVDQAYEADDVATAYWPKSGLVLNVRTAAGLDITEDTALYVGANGVLELAGADEARAPFGYAAENINTGDVPELVAVKFV